MTAAGLRGALTVSDKAVRKIAERSATEATAGPGTGATKGSADVSGRRADVSVDVTLPYPTPLPEAVRSLQQHVTARTHQLTGLDIGTARVGVTALVPAPATAGTVSLDKVSEDEVSLDDSSGAGITQPPSAGRTPRRWWSQRRLPTLLLTLAAAMVCGALALDLILVHAAHRPAAAWRTAALDWLSQHGPGDPTVTACAVAVAVLGLLLIVLALAPGHRGLLTVTAPDPRLRAAVDRAAVASLVRDAVGATQGIGPVKVRVRHRRVTVRAGLAFGDRALAHHEVRHAAHRALEGCELRRVPRLRVKVRPEATWDPGTTTEDSGGREPIPTGGDTTTEPGFEGANH
ncbi:DUF6286 domain-containing Asp23/Gls24 family envelope stress response protein [Streptomyces apricus]|uniref:Asp23/Gls24 family envelope stress response protein n=1 Tax=Streptomyces apricus TaxID=1828112 RepID=A0A5B0BL56_9ACTN|nr:DUF6286 domain-containing protein [Streptomyces apricus]KAA0942181.1 Asp23/Gls24 family envelope stress response protein [Streptomyces apricus]